MRRSIAAALLISLLLPAAARVAAAEDDPTIVTVNGVPIRKSEVFDRLWARFGPPLLEQMVDEILLREAARKRDIKASPKEVQERLDRLQEGFPSRAQFEEHLRSRGTSLAAVRKEIREQLVITKLVTRENKISVKDDEVRDAFKEHKDKLGQPPSIHLRHILVKTAKDADDVIAKVKKGADFKKLAAEVSLAPTGKLNGGDYGEVFPGMLPPDMEEVAFKMETGELKKVESPRGWHVFQVLAKKAGAPARFQQVKDDLREAIMGEKIKQVLPDFLRDLRAKAEIKPQEAK